MYAICVCGKFRHTHTHSSFAIYVYNPAQHDIWSKCSLPYRLFVAVLSPSTLDGRTHVLLAHFNLQTADRGRFLSWSLCSSSLAIGRRN